MISESTDTPNPVSVLPLSDDERRILLAWRQAKRESKNGIAYLAVVKLYTEVLLFTGTPAGKVLLR